MPSLLELQARFAAELDRDDSAGRGVGVYRHAIRATYRRALAASYPVTSRLLGEDFHAAVDAFVQGAPPLSGDLNVYGAGFDDFLARYAPAASLPILPDVARLEWALDEAARADDAHAVPAAIIATISVVEDDAVSELRMSLHPSCRFVSSRFPLLQTWRQYQGTDESQGPVDSQPAGGDHLLVRRVGPRPAIERLIVGEFTWLCALQAGASFGEALAQALAADSAFDLGEALKDRVFDGTICAVSGTPPV